MTKLCAVYLRHGSWRLELTWSVIVNCSGCAAKYYSVISQYYSVIENWKLHGIYSPLVSGTSFTKTWNSKFDAKVFFLWFENFVCNQNFAMHCCWSISKLLCWYFIDLNLQGNIFFCKIWREMLRGSCQTVPWSTSDRWGLDCWGQPSHDIWSPDIEENLMK